MTFRISDARGATFDSGRSGARSVIWGKAAYWSRTYNVRLWIYINGACIGSVHARKGS